MLKKNLSAKNNINNIIKRNQDNKIITVNRIFPNVCNTPRLNIINNRISSENNINTINTTKEITSFVYRKSCIENPKSYIEKPKSLYHQNNNNSIDTNKMTTLDNNSINDSIFYISSRRNIETINNSITTNFTNGKKRLKVRRKYDPVCQLHYKHNSVNNNHINKINDINLFNKTPRDEISVYKSKNYNNCSYYNKNSNSNRNTNFLSSKTKTQMINSSSSTTLSYSESIKNKIKKLKTNTLNNVNYTSHFSIDYSFDKKQPIIYKKTIVTPVDCYSFDDKEKEKEKENENEKYMNENNNNLNTINKNINEENIPLVTFGNEIKDNKNKNKNKNKNMFRKSQNLNSNRNNKYNGNNNKYIDKLKLENEILKNELIKTNEKIFLLENKIENLIEEKNININKYNQIKTNPYPYKKNNINNIRKCPEPTPYVQKFTKKDFFPKEQSIQNIKVTLKSKDKIKPVIERIFRSYNNKKQKSIKTPHENKNYNIQIKRINNKGKNIIISPPSSIIKTKIEIKPNKNKRFFHEFQNQIGFIIA